MYYSLVVVPSGRDVGFTYGAIHMDMCDLGIRV